MLRTRIPRRSLDVVLLHGSLDGDVLLGREDIRAEGAAARLTAVGAVADDLDGGNTRVSGCEMRRGRGEGGCGIEKEFG